jgi:paraquat-inducible protein B
MSHGANKYKLGVFVVVAFLMLLTSLFVLGALNIFKTRIHCLTVVSGSVQGLAIGAKVKYNGVPIGEVKNVRVSPIGDDVYIYMDIYPEHLDYLMEGRTAEHFKNKFIKEVHKGLRCQLRYEGITGALYQEIQYFPLNNFPTIKKPRMPVDQIYIPSVAPVLFDNILKRIDTSLEKLSQIDKVFDKVNRALSKINNFLASNKLKNAITDLEKTSNNVSSITDKLNKTLTEKRIEKFSTELEDTMSEIRKLASNVNTQLTETDFPSTAASIRNSIKETAEKLNEAINNFNSVAHSVELLSDELNESPNMLIWGKSKKQIIPSH